MRLGSSHDLIICENLPSVMPQGLLPIVMFVGMEKRSCDISIYYIYIFIYRG